MFASSAVDPCTRALPPSSPLAAPALPALPPLPIFAAALGNHAASSSTSPTAQAASGPIRRRYACPHCSLDFPKSGNRNRHIENKHPREVGRSQLECALCGQAFWCSNKLNKHASKCQGAPAAAAGPLSPTLADSSHAAAPVASDRSSSTTKRLSRTSNHSSISNDDINTASTDYFAWLTEPPLPTEHMLRKVASPDAVAQQREAVRQLVREADVEMPALFAHGVQLRSLVLPDVVKAVISAMHQRKVCASTIYARALLLKKVAVWMCSRQSRLTQKYIAPDTLPAWPLIAHHCSSATVERKRDHLSRRLRGTDDHKWMTGEEKNKLLGACLAKLHELQQPSAAYIDTREYTDHFIVALLLLGLAPRQQTFRALTTDMVRPPGTDKRTPDQYVIDGEHGKTKMVYYVAVHPVLTSSTRFYLDRVLGAGYSGSLFLQMSGAARQDFTPTTRSLTKRYVGRPITAGKFRMTVATDLLSRGGVNGKALAELMGHTEATQRAFYIGVHMAEEARVCQDALLEGVAVPEGMMA